MSVSSKIRFELLVDKLKKYYFSNGKLAENGGDLESIVGITATMLKDYLLGVDTAVLAESLDRLLCLSGVDFHGQFLKTPMVPIMECLHASVKPSDSCGDITRQLGDILLAPELAVASLFTDNEEENRKNGFKTIGQGDYLRDIEGINEPRFIRVDIERLTAKHQWVSSHSYLILVEDQQSRSHVFQSYAQHFTLQEWLDDEQCRILSSLPLTKHFATLAELHCEDEKISIERQSTRGEVYSTLFRRSGGDAIPSKNYPIRVNYTIQPIDAERGIVHLEQLEKKIEESLHAHKMDRKTLELDLSDRILAAAGVSDSTLRKKIIEAVRKYEVIHQQAVDDPGYFYGY